MNIFVGKIGKSILFNSKSWGSTGGDNEAPKYYENLFHRNPDHKFYVLGANDLTRIPRSDWDRINKFSNVINIWDTFAEWRKGNQYLDKDKNRMLYLNWWVKQSGIIFDCGLLFAGPTGTSNVVGLTTTMRDNTQLAKPLIMLSNYVAPIIAFLNEYKYPYALIVNDPRFFPSNARDWFHRPSIVLSQYEEAVITTSKVRYNSAETIQQTIQTSYSGVEKIFLIGLKRGGSASQVEPSSNLNSFFEDAPVIVNGVKDINFLIILNEGRPSRYKLLQESILKDVQDVQIYGKWDPTTIGKDLRFKGSLGFHELQNMLPRVKYTYCIPIKKGWVTSKFWEMAHYGIIPFLHPTYDCQNHLKVPPFLRVSNSQELFKKIKFLDDNPNAYDELRKNIDNMLLDGYYDGTILNDITMDAITKLTTK